MALMRWDPFRDTEDLFDRINRFWTFPAQLKGNQEIMTTSDWVPAVDISETDTEFQIKAEIPEVDKKDIKLANETIEMTKNLTKECEKINTTASNIEGTTTIALSYISESIRRTGEYAANICENIINCLTAE